MRYLIPIFILSTAIFANESVKYFNKSKENTLFCHLGQYSYKMISQKNAVLKNISGHPYFKLKDENLYFLSNSCLPLKDRKERIGF